MVIPTRNAVVSTGISLVRVPVCATRPAPGASWPEGCAVPSTTAGLHSGQTPVRGDL